MSRIGKQPVVIPAGVDVTIDGQNIAVKGPKGTLALDVAEPRIDHAREVGKTIRRLAELRNEARASSRLAGLRRAAAVRGVGAASSGVRAVTGVRYGRRRALVRRTCRNAADEEEKPGRRQRPHGSHVCSLLLRSRPEDFSQGGTSSRVLRRITRH